VKGAQVEVRLEDQRRENRVEWEDLSAAPQSPVGGGGGGGPRLVI
jgi:hypothetical protein